MIGTINAGPPSFCLGPKFDLYGRLDQSENSTRAGAGYRETDLKPRLANFRMMYSKFTLVDIHELEENVIHGILFNIILLINCVQVMASFVFRMDASIR